MNQKKKMKRNKLTAKQYEKKAKKYYFNDYLNDTDIY